jgi:anti-anti-sigma factor
MQPLTVHVRSDHGLVTVTVAGELDASTASGLEAAIDAGLRLARHTLVIDTTDVTFVDVVGRRSLRRLDDAAGVHVVLVRGDAVESFDRRLAQVAQGRAQAA